MLSACMEVLSEGSGCCGPGLSEHITTHYACIPSYQHITQSTHCCSVLSEQGHSGTGVTAVAHLRSVLRFGFLLKQICKFKVCHCTRVAVMQRSEGKNSPVAVAQEEGEIETERKQNVKLGKLQGRYLPLPLPVQEESKSFELRFPSDYKAKALAGVK